MQKGLFKKYIINHRVDTKSSYRPRPTKRPLMRWFKRKSKNKMEKELGDLDEINYNS